MVSKKVLLLSLPWADYRSPSLAIGQLSSFLRSRGIESNAFHLHLEIAANIGLEQYFDISRSKDMVGEALTAAILFTDRRDKMLNYASKKIGRAHATFRSLHRALKNSFAAIDWSQYSIVGFTANFDQLFASLLFAKWIKKTHPNILTVIGGRLVSSELGKSIMELFPQIDWCIDGEGEEAFVRLVESLFKRKNVPLDRIPGLIYRKDGGILTNIRQQLKNVGGFEDPDYSHYFNLIDSHPLISNTDISPYIPIEAGRGCPHNCAFCSDAKYWSGYRLRPPKEVASSLSRMVKRYGICSFYLVALMLTPKYLGKLSSAISGRLKDCALKCEVRPGIPRNTLASMKKAGFSEIQIGLEALDTGILDKMNKGSRLIDNFETLKFCEELGIVHNSNLIANFPTESQHDVNRSIAAIDHAAGYMPPSRIVPFELRIDSSAYCHPKEYGIRRLRNHSFASLLPPKISAHIKLWYKAFDRSKRATSYSKLKRRLEKWRKFYFAARVSGNPLLYYLDYRDHLLIEDCRSVRSSIKLEGATRDIYLYCNSIRSLSDILNQFSNIDDIDILEILKTLCKERIVFMENDDYLSLAIHQSNDKRRNMAFL